MISHGFALYEASWLSYNSSSVEIDDFGFFVLERK